MRCDIFDIAKNKGCAMSKSTQHQAAAIERWHPTVPKATHTGTLIIAGQEIACDVLADGTRVLRKKTVLKAIGRGTPGSKDVKRAKGLNLPIFISANNLTPYLKHEILEEGSLIMYRGIDGRKLQGYKATILPEICKIYVQADHDGVLADNQLKIAGVCKAMLYGLATVGIIALVDDATGYVEKRNRDELQKILENYISEELRPWTKKFPNEFFKQVYRLHGWEYPRLQKNHPQYIGKIINKYVYEKLPPGVIEELKKKNPVNESGIRSYRHHQFLTEDIGDDNLNKQIMQVVTVMKLSSNIDEFKQLIERL
jgi:hypothetical protein